MYFFTYKKWIKKLQRLVIMKLKIQISPLSKSNFYGGCRLILLAMGCYYYYPRYWLKKNSQCKYKRII